MGTRDSPEVRGEAAVMAVSRWCKSARCQGTAGESSSTAQPALVEIGLSIAWARRIRSVLSRRYFGGFRDEAASVRHPWNRVGSLLGPPVRTQNARSPLSGPLRKRDLRDDAGAGRGGLP